MPKFSVKLVAALALAGLSLGNHSPVSAQDEAGEVTITDSQPEAITESEQLPIPGDGSSGQAMPYSGGSAGDYSGGYGADSSGGYVADYS
ncbi:MAG: hypothetical protein KDA84_23165, partial [Planctomycetaceae bacterium]|nr:hypothetical protein [Planctomycetaceae bacterium]